MMLGKWNLPLAIVAAFTTFALAEGETSLDARIEAIKQAPPQERRLLMNRLKMDLAKMNRQQRMEAIQHLRASMKPHMQGRGAAEHGTHPRPPMEQMAERDQMRQTGQMGHREGMGQRQGVDQFMHGQRPDRGHVPFGGAASGGGGTPAAGGSPSAGGVTPPANGSSAGHGKPRSSPMPFGREMRR